MSQTRIARFAVLVALMAVGSTLGAASAAAPDLPGPSIVSFSVQSGPGNQRIFSGLTNADPGTVITFSGLPQVEGRTATVDNNGYFSLTVEIPQGVGGDVTATGRTPNGQTTNTAFCYVTP